VARPESAEQALLRQEFGAVATLGNAGQTAAAPAAGTVITAIVAPTPGRYRVRASAQQRGTIDATRFANVGIYQNAVLITTIMSTDLPTPSEDVIADVAGGNLDLRVIAVGAAGSVFVGQIQADLLD